MEVIYAWQVNCKWIMEARKFYVVCRKGKRTHLLRRLVFLLVEGRAKWPYKRVIQRRNTHENDPGRIQSKTVRNLLCDPYNPVVQNMGFAIREIRFYIPVSISN